MSADGEHSPTRFAVWRNLVGIATGLSVIVGVLISMTQLVEWINDSKRANVAARLDAFAHVETFLQADAAVRRRGRRFVKEGLPQILPRLETLVAQAGNGEDFYLSPALEDFAAVHHHYEQMGALVKLGYVEFALIFEIVAYPDDYFRAVKPVRDAIAAHWKGMGQPLKDFGANIAYLKSCYEKSRQAAPQPPSCPAP
ncbi:MAG: hypothetical protein U5L05_00875 [Rubrivivax sp.]|nr:hypothetical protein [Rubrivivax sp.]